MYDNGKLVDYNDTFYDGYNYINENHLGIINIRLDEITEVYNGKEYHIVPPSQINEIFPAPDAEKAFKELGNITNGKIAGEEHLNLMSEHMLQYIKECVKEDRLYRFYKSKQMLELRKYVIRKHRTNCIRCRAYGKLTITNVVHHIIHVKDNPSLALMENNLVPLCHSCHNVVHPEKQEHFEKYLNKPRFNDERWE